MNLAVDKMLELAMIVTGEQHIADPVTQQVFAIVQKDGHPPMYGRRFLPSLTGEDWQKSQALDCIVAAENSPQHQQYRDHVANGMPSFQAAISALLGKE